MRTSVAPCSYIRLDCKLARIRRHALLKVRRVTLLAALALLAVALLAAAAAASLARNAAQRNDQVFGHHALKDSPAASHHQHRQALHGRANHQVLSIVVIVARPHHVPPAQLAALLRSLHDARYPADHAVVLHVVISATRVLHKHNNTPRHSQQQARMRVLEHKARSATWTHGAKTITTVSKGSPTWEQILAQSNPDHHNLTTTLFVVADNAAQIAPRYYDYLRTALAIADPETHMKSMQDTGITANRSTATPHPNDQPHAHNRHASGPPILAVALDSIIVAHGNVTGTAVRVSDFFPASAAFAPTHAAMALFLRWLAVQAQGGYHRAPVVPKSIVWENPADHDHEADPRLWFAHFVHAYGGHVLYPVLDDGKLLVSRSITSHNIASNPLDGSSGKPSAHKSLRLRSKDAGDKCCRLQSDDTEYSAVQFPPQITQLTVLGELGLNRVVPMDKDWRITQAFLSWFPRSNIDAGVDAESSWDSAKHELVAERIAKFGREKGNGSVSFTLVTSAFVETACSWICNVLAIKALPRALVLGASDVHVKQVLEKFIVENLGIPAGDVLVEDVGGALHVGKTENGTGTALNFGTTEYWHLMLERTALLRDILDAGIGVLHFETDQVWFEDPMPWIERAMELTTSAGSQNTLSTVKEVDMVVTINTRQEVSGNFFYLRPSLATRHVWSLVTAQFLASYRRSPKTKVSTAKMYNLENDQSLLTNYVLGHVPWYVTNFPMVRYAVLDRQRFVDGTWYRDFEDKQGRRRTHRKYYTSEDSLRPVVLNNNFIIGVDAKKRRAQRFGHWFWAGEQNMCNASLRRTSAIVAVDPRRRKS